MYTPIPIHTIQIQDSDRNTQLCSLQITTITGFFQFNTSLLEWKEGNYGEGMDDNKVIAIGSISDMNNALETIRYRAVYRLNDTMVLIITDGNYTATGRIELIYTPEESNGLSERFFIIVCLVCALIICGFVSICWNCCQSCRSSKKKDPMHPKKTLRKKTMLQKKVPPPLPKSLPPTQRTLIHSKTTTPDNIEFISKKSAKPPSVK